MRLLTLITFSSVFFLLFFTIRLESDTNKKNNKLTEYFSFHLLLLTVYFFRDSPFSIILQ